MAASLLVGFRPNANAVEWLAAAGVVAMTGFALVWLAVAFGLASKTVDSSGNIAFPSF